jgi:hypothetical protein
MSRKHHTDGQGPDYNISSAGLSGWRRKASSGLSSLSREQVRQYAEEVERAVLSAQRSALLGALEPEHRPNCASRSWDTFPGDAVRRQQAAELAAYASKVRRQRTAEKWVTMYREAMEACGKPLPVEVSS